MKDRRTCPPREFNFHSCFIYYARYIHIGKHNARSGVCLSVCLFDCLPIRLLVCPVFFLMWMRQEWATYSNVNHQGQHAMQLYVSKSGKTLTYILWPVLNILGRHLGHVIIFISGLGPAVYLYCQVIQSWRRWYRYRLPTVMWSIDADLAPLRGTQSLRETASSTVSATQVCTLYC